MWKLIPFGFKMNHILFFQKAGTVMIGYTNGFILRNVTAKTKGLHVFMDDVNKLALRASSETDVRSHLNEGGFLVAVYKKGKTNKLKGYYLFKTEKTDCTGLKGSDVSGIRKCAVLKERFLDKDVTAEQREALDKEIQCSFLEDMVTGQFYAAVFDDNYISIDRKGVTRTLIKGIITGLLIGIILYLLIRKTAVAVLLSILWIITVTLISMTGELERQKNTLRGKKDESQ